MSRQTIDPAVIVAEATEIRRICGVYFLIDYAGEIVYVGQSVNVLSRVLQHEANGVQFNKVTILVCDQAELNHEEEKYIKALQPRLNHGRDGCLVLPVRKGRSFSQRYYKPKQAAA